MQDLFELTPELLLEQSQEMFSLCSAFETLFGNITSDLNGINNSWSDLLSNNFSGKISSAQKAFSGTLVMLRNSASSAQMVAEAAQETDTEWASKIMGALGMSLQASASLYMQGDETAAATRLDVSSYCEKVTDAEYAALCMHWQRTVEALENGELTGDVLSNFLKSLQNSEYLPDGDPIKNLSADQVQIFQSASGLSAVAIGEGDSAIVIFAGTNFSTAQDIYADAQIVAGMPSLQATEAALLVKNLSAKYSNITVTGHSLGGYLATASTLKTGVVDKCVVFDPPGRYDNLGQAVLNSEQYAKIKTYEVRGSVVSAVGFGTGQVESVEITGDPLYHDIGKICESLNKDGAIQESWATP